MKVENNRKCPALRGRQAIYMQSALFLADRSLSGPLWVGI